MTGVAGLEREIAARIGKLFVQRRDVKAVQNKLTGGYARVSQKITMSDLVSHIKGETSIGHYLVGNDGNVRLFAFDIDLVKNNAKRPVCYWPEDPANEANPKIREFIPRDAWADRSHPSRDWTKFQMMTLATKIASVITDPRPGGWGLRCLVTYSGSKGVHVYAFFPEGEYVPAADAREAGKIVMEELGWVRKRAGINDNATGSNGTADSYNPEPTGGSGNFWVCPDRDPVTGFPNFEIEVYPKQDKVSEGRYGNLMRLPLGHNFKAESPKEPAFIIDCTAPYGIMRPVANPLAALHTLNPFLQAGEGA